MRSDLAQGGKPNGARRPTVSVPALVAGGVGLSAIGLAVALLGGASPPAPVVVAVAKGTVDSGLVTATASGHGANPGPPASAPAPSRAAPGPAVVARPVPVPGEGANVVLSFDDGSWEPGRADAILAALRAHDARVLFFPTGRWLEQNAGWRARALGDGHRICNHTQDHLDLTDPALADEALRRQIVLGGQGSPCRLLRPPKMAFDRRAVAIAHELGYRLLLWDVDSRDAAGADRAAIVDGVLREVRPGAVVLLHFDGEGLLALPELLEALVGAGYRPTYRPEEVAPARFSLGRRQAWAAEGGMGGPREVRSRRGGSPAVASPYAALPGQLAELLADAAPRAAGKAAHPRRTRDAVERLLGGGDG